MTDCTSKQCTKCKEWKLATNEYFRKRSDSKDGLAHECKACGNARWKVWHSNNVQKHRDNAKKWRLDNPEKHSEHVNTWWRDNRDRKREYNKQYRAKHRDQTNGYSRKYAKRNPHIRKNVAQRRRSRIRALHSDLTQNQWEDILADFNYSCAYCGKAWYEISGILTQDHVIPVVQGGAYTKDNIVPACNHCNIHKSGRTPEQAGMPIIRPF